MYNIKCMPTCTCLCKPTHKHRIIKRTYKQTPPCMPTSEHHYMAASIHTSTCGHTHI